MTCPTWCTAHDGQTHRHIVTRGRMAVSLHRDDDTDAADRVMLPPTLSVNSDDALDLALALLEAGRLIRDEEAEAQRDLSLAADAILADLNARP